MKSISEEKLDLYVINPSLLNKSEIDFIESRIKESSEFREKIENIKEFYNIYHSLSDIKISNEEFLNRVKMREQKKITDGIYTKQQNTFLLTPLYERENEEKYVKLAAQQKLKKDRQFKYINTLASADDIVLIRVLWNYSTNEYNLFLVMDEMDKVEYALLNFEDYPDNYVADKNGLIKIKIEYHFDDINARVHLPIVKFFISNQDITKLKKSEKVTHHLKNESITFSKKDDKHLSVTFDFNEEFYKRHKLKEEYNVIVIYNDDVKNALIKKLEDKTLTIPFRENQNIIIVVVN